jgi:hypothetical protein
MKLDIGLLENFGQSLPRAALIFGARRGACRGYSSLHA